MANSSLPSAPSLFSMSIQTVKEKFGTIAGILLVPTVLTALAQIGKTAAQQSVSNALSYGLLSFIAGIISVIGSLALVYAVSDKKSKSVIAYYKQGLGSFFRYFIVALCSGLVVMGGMLLFIIPGIVWSIWLSQALFVSVLEGKSGYAALKRSKYLVQGQGWAIIGKQLFLLLPMIGAIIVMVIVTGVLAAATHVIGLSTVTIAVLNTVFQMLFAAVSVAYTYHIYQGLVKMKGNGTDNTSWTYALLSIVGVLIIPVALVLGILGALFAKKAATQLGTIPTTSVTQRLTVGANMVMSVEALNTYYSGKHAYPATLAQLKDYYPKGTVAADTAGLTYTMKNAHYTLCATLDEKETPVCVTDAMMQNPDGLQTLMKQMIQTK